MLRNKIFVTSQEKGTSLDFVKNIFKTSKTDFPQKDVDESLKETNGAVEGIRVPYELNTKYYKAKVDFWLDEPTQVEAIEAYSKSEEVVQVIDAFVFCFEKSKPETFKTLEKWTPFLEEAEPSIKLCIANSSKEPLANEVEFNDWCLSHGFDYVDMDEKTDIPMDKVGYELALEILQTHFWDGMIKKKSDGTLEDEEEEDDDLIKDIQDLKLQQYKDILELEEDEEDAFDMPTQEEISKMQEELFGDIDGEDGLDKAFEAIQAMREHGKDLSDEERRKMAAKVALSFAAQLGL